jgi:hypothetical protein
VEVQVARLEWGGNNIFAYFTKLVFKFTAMNKMKKLFLLCLVLFSVIAQAQIKRFTVTGKIVDKDKLPVIGASTVLLNPTDSVMIGFSNTNEDGVFTIKAVKPATLNFQVTYIGFGTIQKSVKIGGEVAIVDLGEITMSDDANLLNEVVVKGEFIPIKIKKDTVEYNPDAFRVRPNASVEELLKKLPGVEVADDGTVTAQGEAVSGVTVDGKKFFGNNVQMATRNLPADAIKKVQFIDKKSDKAQFSGISDGTTEKVMNLELKDNKKVGSFGNLSAGIGNEDRYELGGNYNKFSSEYQLGSVLKINNQSKTGINTGEYASLTGSAGGGGRGGGNLPSIVNQGGNPSGQVESATGGLNLYRDFSKKTNATVSYFLNGSDQNLIENSKRESFLGDQNFVTLDNTRSNANNISHNFNLNFQSRPDSLHRIDLESSYTLRNRVSVKNIENFNESLSRTRINENYQSDSTDSNTNNFSLRGTISRRLNKPGRILTMSGSYGNNVTDQLYNIESFKLLLRSKDTLLQNQVTNNLSKNYNINLEYKEPLGKRNYLGLELQRRNNKSDQDKEFYDLDPITTREELNKLLSNLFRNDVSYTRATVQYTKDAENFSFNFDLGFQQSVLKGSSSNPTFTPINKPYNYLLPSLNFDWSKINLRFRYNKQVNEPSATQLQQIVDNSDPFNIYRGNPNLKPESTHNLNLRYFFFDNFNFRTLFAFINYRNTQDNIVTSQTISPALVRESSPLNKGVNHNLSFNLSYGTPIKPLSIKARISPRLTYNQGINFINGKENQVKTISPGANIELENTNNEVVSLLGSYTYNLSQNKYDVNVLNNTEFTTHNLRSNLIVNFGKGFNLNSDLNHTIYSKAQFGDQNTLTLLNAGVTKRIMKDRITLGFRFEDIFNVGQGINRNATQTYLEEVTSNAIGRFAMFSVNYRLSAFSGNTMRPGPPRPF